MYKKCLEIRIQVLGTDHLDVAEVESCIGQVWAARGVHRTALGNLMSAMRTRKKLLAKLALPMAKTYFVVGKVLHEMGDLDESFAMMEKCLAIQKRQLGRHRETALTLAYMGLLFGERTAAFGNGLRMARDAQAILEESVGVEHPDTAFAYSVIPSLLRQRSPHEGLALMKRSVAILEKSLGAQHPCLYNPCFRLGEMLQLEGNYVESLKCYRQAIEISKDSLGGIHLAVARVYAKMSVVLCQLQNEAMESKRMHQKVMDILGNCEGSNRDQKLLRIYCQAAEDFYSIANVKASFLFFRRGLDVKGAMLMVLGFDPPTSLAACYAAIDSIEYDNEAEVVEACRRCLSAEMDDDSLAASQPTELIGGVTTKWLEHRRRSL